MRSMIVGSNSSRKCSLSSLGISTVRSLPELVAHEAELAAHHPLGQIVVGAAVYSRCLAAKSPQSLECDPEQAFVCSPVKALLPKLLRPNPIGRFASGTR